MNTTFQNVHCSTTLLIFLALLISPTVIAQSFDVSWEAHGSLRITNPANEQSIIVDDCWMKSSKTGAFLIPRPTGDTLIGVSCAQSDELLRVHVIRVADLTSLYNSPPTQTLNLRLLPQGLMISTEVDNTIWDAPDNHFGSAEFLDTNGLASGLPYRPGQILWPRLDAGKLRVANDPTTPLRLGPADNAPYFARMRGYLLIHLGEGHEDGFWQIGDFVRLCIPDGGCGYARKSTVQPVLNRDDNPIAAAMMTESLGPRDPDLACWTGVDDNTLDRAVRCYRILEVFNITGTQAGVLVVATGVEILDDGTLMRCSACQVSLLLAFAADAMPEKVVVSDSILMGTWGEGPTVADLALDIPNNSTSWQLNVAEVYNDSGTVLVRSHAFSPTATNKIEHRLVDPVPREQHREHFPGILRVEYYR